MNKSRKIRHYVVCLSNAGHPASLEPRKIYEMLPDADAAKEGLVRVIDESGENYLYPRTNFVEIKIPRDMERAFAS